MMDERIRKEQQAIGNQGFLLLYIGIWLLLFVKVVLLRAPAEPYREILVLLTAVSFYLVVQNLRKGIYVATTAKNSYKNQVKGVLIGGIGAAAVICGIQYYQEGSIDIEWLVTFLVVMLFTQLIVRVISKKLAAREAEKWKDDDDR